MYIWFYITENSKIAILRMILHSKPSYNQIAHNETNNCPMNMRPTVLESPKHALKDGQQKSRLRGHFFWPFTMACTLKAAE